MVEQLYEFLDLEDDWDGEGAKSFNKDFIDFVSAIVMELDIQPDIFPLQDGSIVLEFGNVRNNYLELTLNPTRLLNIYKKDESGNRSRENSIMFSMPRIVQEVTEFGNRVLF